MAPPSLTPILGAAIAAALVSSYVPRTSAAPPPPEPISIPASDTTPASPEPAPGPLLREATAPVAPVAPVVSGPTVPAAPAPQGPAQPVVHESAPQRPEAPTEVRAPSYWAPYPPPKPEEFPPPEAHEPFDASERNNIFNQKISREWDPEKIINTDRPDFTDVLPTVGKHVWQTESGTAFRHRVGEGYSFNRTSVPETTLRLGVSDHFELRIKWDSFMFSQRTGTANGGTNEGKSAYGSDFLVGFKWLAVPQAGWLPGHTFLGTLTSRIGTGGPAQTLIQPGVNWVYGWQINKWMVLRGSTGVEIVIVTPQHRLVDGVETLQPSSARTVFDLHQSVVTYLQVVKRLGMYLEWFSFYDHGAERTHQHNGGVGFYIYLTPNIQIDLRGGGTIVGTHNEVFTGAGISFRGKYKYKKRKN